MPAHQTKTDRLSTMFSSRKQTADRARSDASTVSSPGRRRDDDILPKTEEGTLSRAHLTNSQSLCRGDSPPAYASTDAHTHIYRPEVLQTIDAALALLDPQLRELSLDIWRHPELMWEEVHAHDALTSFMSARGFAVTPHYLGLRTAWRAEYVHVSSSSSPPSHPRVIGVNAEMDALPGIGHACGHNLIAAAGVGVALALKAALEAHDVSGRIVLLGTPAEEGGGGKIVLSSRGAYDEMQACIMCHPSGGPLRHASLGPSLAIQTLDVEFKGHGAHAAAHPWEGRNALDAAFLAYSSIAMLRQQMKPTHRVHGIVTGKDWAPNVIPDNATLKWIVRAPTRDEVAVLSGRVKACFEAAAQATACEVVITDGITCYDLVQNRVLGDEFGGAVAEYGVAAEYDEGMSASTDFGNVTYQLPSLHPVFSIPTEPNGQNHTPAFTAAAAAPEAHAAALVVMKGLAMAGFRVLDDAEFADRVQRAWEEDMGARK